jgi:hypothetical protein
MCTFEGKDLKQNINGKIVEATGKMRKENNLKMNLAINNLHFDIMR